MIPFNAIRRVFGCCFCIPTGRAYIFISGRALIWMSYSFEALQKIMGWSLVWVVPSVTKTIRGRCLSGIKKFHANWNSRQRNPPYLSNRRTLMRRVTLFITTAVGVQPSSHSQTRFFFIANPPIFLKIKPVIRLRMVLAGKLPPSRRAGQGDASIFRVRRNIPLRVAALGNL